MSKKDKLLAWLDKEIIQAKENGEEIFMGIPDRWYEPLRHCCINGHISHRYLKSELKGNVCLACGESVYVFPADATEENLHLVLSLTTQNTTTNE